MLRVSESQRLPIVEEGVYTAICTGLIDLGEQENETYHKVNRQVRILWELVGVTYEVNEEEHTRQISRDFTQSLSEKSNLRSFLEAWRNRAFTAEELNGFDLNAVLGKACQLQVMHKEGNKGTFAVVNSVFPLSKGTKVPRPMNTQVVFDMDDPDTYPEFEMFPEFLQKKIAAAKNFDATGIEYGGGLLDDEEDEKRPTAAAANAAPKAAPVQTAVKNTKAQPASVNVSSMAAAAPAPETEPVSFSVGPDEDLSFEIAG